MSNFIKDFSVKYLSDGFGIDGDNKTNYRFEMFLENPIELNVFGIKYVIDRIVYRSEMYGYYGIMLFANNNTEFQGFKIPKKLFLSVYKKIRNEEKNGALKGYCFSEELEEIYQDKIQNIGVTYIIRQK